MSHIEHESCNSIGINLVLAAVVAIEHVCPVKCGDGQVLGGLGDILSHVSCAVAILVARNNLSGLRWIIVVFHYLRHGGCHAASVGGLILTVLVLHLWTLVPVGACLVPLGSEQWSYRVAGVDHVLCSSDSTIDSRKLIEHRDLLRILVEQVLHVRRSLSLVEVTFVAIAQDGIDAVIA